MEVCWNASNVIGTFRLKSYQGEYILFRTGSHFEGPVETGHQDLKLLNILLFVFQHPEYQTVWIVCWKSRWKLAELRVKDGPVPFAHALGVRRFDVLFDDDFPSVSTQPSAEESLNFSNFFQIIQLDIASQSARTLSTSIGLSVGTKSRSSSAGQTDPSSSSSVASDSASCAGREPPLLFQGAQLRQYFGKVNKRL